ncbi:restriction endonuclease subunit S [Enterococcus faecalis]|uniref:restriction endonuclease subunit S n=1 Tax=Enterococcus faecalis TaxID=1351 RepID=UPI001D18CEB0|nr:restriction endonuclease subunit S [Enterococcus faecalis]MCC4085607.1 restriction endonuclease subunit S [Enterococcus faecalis]
MKEIEVPYELPVGWEWARIASATKNITAGGDKPKEVSSEKTNDFQIPIYSNGIKDNGLYGWAKEAKVFEPSVTVSARGTIGFTAIRNHPFVPIVRLISVTPLERTVDVSFLKYMLSHLIPTGEGTSIPQLTVPGLKPFLIALPPYHEQLKIVQSIKSYLKLIDEIDNNQLELNNITVQLKQKVLDVAMQGKLVPQDPNDEPASVLLEKIRAEKLKLFEEGKLKKKDLVETEIVKGDDNAYYKKLPKGWSITNLQRLTTPITLNDGDWIVSKDMTVAPEIKLIQLGSIGFGKYIDKGFKYITEETFNQLNCTEIHSGYLMVNRLIAEQMYVTMLPRIEGKKITAVDVCWISPTKYFSLRFMMFQMMGQRFQKQAIQLGTGSTRLRISKGNLIKIPIVLPPIEEQERIVPQIEKYLQLIDKSF